MIIKHSIEVRLFSVTGHCSVLLACTMLTTRTYRCRENYYSTGRFIRATSVKKSAKIAGFDCEVQNIFISQQNSTFYIGTIKYTNIYRLHINIKQREMLLRFCKREIFTQVSYLRIHTSNSIFNDELLNMTSILRNINAKQRHNVTVFY